MYSGGVAFKRIMAFGDSNTYRGGRTRWTVLLEKKSGGWFRVINEGYDGRTTRYDTGEGNGLGVIKNKLALYEPLDYIIVMLGTNDVKNKYGPPNAVDIAEGMLKILDVIDAYGGTAKPVLMTPPPLGSVRTGDLAGAQCRIPPVAEEYRLLAERRNIRLIDMNAMIDIRADLETDKVHLNARGRRKVADVVWENLLGFSRHLNWTLYASGFKR